MTRKDYLEQLEKYLSKLPQQDFAEAMEYFTEYFDEAGPENEAQVISELGSPKEAANELLYRLLDEKINQDSRNMKHRTNLIWIAVLAILASPIAFPLLITFIVLIFTAVILIFSLLLAGVSVAVAFFIAGIDLVIEAFMSSIASDFAGALVELGLGGLFLGLPLLLFLLILQISKWCSQLIVSSVRKVAAKGRRKS
ncbi:DUF1700 domain-containing protein [Streptococcus chenjunshii]|uniref:DUF1700 domain-containing protein n=1 Tax=Streptococcus chenjunshii TaxID=2173853 RepID=A0A372KPR3_9STRE|nr:DUF1700 domain-containing protein [Streptococcus chenjunshii]AXQ78482.1 DUF1700 domain-containing protein [Streptococcus chenjunshii]RFU52057.1 DUF1700 domain-containing protein [Streptococcus chenjunshii]RFU54249.1 DUF1700 domain-containing protein [Streptococcus chenjunshii]